MAKPVIAELVSTFNIGGAETLVLGLAQALRDEGFDPIAIAVRSGGPLEERFAKAQIETCVSGRTGFPCIDLPGIKRLANILKEKRVQVLHCHNRLAHIYGAFAAKIAGVPVVVCTRHSALTDGRPQKAHVLERIAKHLTDHFIAVSENVRQLAAELGRIAGERSCVIHNGIDTSRFTPATSATKGPPTLICVARLDPVKSHGLLLRSVASLRSNGIELGLKIVGDGPTRQNIEEQIAELHLQDCVETLGARSDVAELLAAADIFVLPSKSEGLPMTIIEAMACGLPVVASDVGGVSELVRPNLSGFLVQAENENAMTEALEKIVTDRDLRQRMGTAGRDIATAQFDIRVIARLHAELFRDLMQQKGVAVEDCP
jgi:L-malate glycosyltransferase